MHLQGCPYSEHRFSPAFKTHPYLRRRRIAAVFSARGIVLFSPSTLAEISIITNFLTKIVAGIHF